MKKRIDFTEEEKNDVLFEYHNGNEVAPVSAFESEELELGIPGFAGLSSLHQKTTVAKKVPT